MPRTYHRPRSLKPVTTHYCAGCGHGLVHKLLAELIDELDIRERTIGIAPVDYGDAPGALEQLLEAQHPPPPATALASEKPILITSSRNAGSSLAAMYTLRVEGTRATWLSTPGFVSDLANSRSFSASLRPLGS